MIAPHSQEARLEPGWAQHRHAEHHKSRTRQITRHTVQILAVRRQPRLELDDVGRAEAAREIARYREQGWT